MTVDAVFRHSVRLVSPNVNTPTFSHLLLAVDWQRQLDDPDYLAFVAGLYLLALEPEEQEPNELRARRYLWED